VSLPSALPNETTNWYTIITLLLTALRWNVFSH
jgi:hypothetical protein